MPGASRAGVDRGERRTPVARRGYSPVNRGGRFSRNAASPSAWSAVAPAMPWSTPRPRAPSSRSIDQVRSRARFVEREGRGRQRGEPRGERPRLVGERVGRHDPRDEPEPLRVRGRQRLAEQRQLGGLGRADEPRQEPRRAAVRTSPIRPNASRKLAVLGGDPEVAGERERGAGAGGDAVDRADDRLVERAHRPDERVVALAELDVERRRVGLEPLLEVLAGTERPAGAGQDDGPDRRVARRPPGTPPSSSSLSGTVSALSASGRSSVIVATPSATSSGASRRRRPSAAHQAPATPRTRRAGRRRARTRAGRSARRRRPTARRRSRAKSAAKSSSPGAERAGDQEVPLRDADEDPAARPELADEVVDDLGQQDPGGVPAVAGVAS